MKTAVRGRRALATFAVLLTTLSTPAQEDWRDAPLPGLPTYGAASMALEQGNRVLRFGGYELLPVVPPFVGPPPLQPTAITQLWDGASWSTVQNLAVAPPARAYALMDYDPGRGRTVLHGGVDAAGVVLTDTWEWDGVQWAQVLTPTAPPPRLFAGIGHDSQNLVMFGGRDLAMLPMGDTWSYDGVTWTLRATASAPAPRQQHAMAGGAGQILLFGGYGANGVFGDTWRWNGFVWTQSTPAVSPAARGAAAMTYDPSRDGFLLHGANFPFQLRDTWQYVSGQWSAIPTDRSPYGVVYQQDAWHPPTGRWVVSWGAPSPSPYGISMTSEFGLDLAYVSGYGVGCSPATPGPLTIELVAGQPQPGGSFSLEVAPAAGIAFLALGWSDTVGAAGPLPLSLAAIGGAPECSLWNSADVVLGMQAPAVTISIPNTLAVVGLEFFAQGFDLPGLSLANLRVTRGFACGVDIN